MERADLLYSGLMLAAAGMLGLWTAILVTAAFVRADPLCPKNRNSHCYNRIYKISWCRRVYAPSFLT